MIAWLALTLALVALVYAWRLQQELATATRRLDRYNRALFDANDEVRRLNEKLAETTAQLRVELKRTSGSPLFQPTMTVREAGLLHPQALQIMAGLHLGGCSSCAVEPDTTLAQACADHGVDLNTLLHNLNLLVAKGNGQLLGTPQPVKLPNLALEF
jgi:hypothetical protein